MLKLKATLALGTAILCLSTPALAQQQPAAAAQNMPPLSIRVLANMGRSGLLGTMASNERYGTVQSRVALGRAMSALTEVPGNPEDGYRDGITDMLAPLSAMVRLNKGPSDSAHYLRFSSNNRWSDGWPTRNGVAELESDSEAHGLGVQYFYAPNTDLMVGLGIEVDRNEVDIRHADGEAEIRQIALRGDVLKKLHDNWGVALRAGWFEETSETEIPLPFGMLEVEQDASRLYLQADAVGTFTKADIAALPEGWMLRPTIGTAWQKTWFEETTNSFGEVEKGPRGESSDEYGSIYANAALSFGGLGKVQPYVGLGLDHEYTNSYADYVDESTYLNSFVGATIKLSQSALLNVNYGRYDGFNGNREKEAFVVAFGVTF